MKKWLVGITHVKNVGTKLIAPIALNANRKKREIKKIRIVLNGNNKITRAFDAFICKDKKGNK